jgi:enolase-phosphatase E1
MAAVAAVVTDIEGTTTPIAFVHQVLFPYARAHLPAFVEAHATDPDVAAALAEVRRLAPGQAALDALLRWMDDDEKVTPLKTLQGLVWHDGYASGALQSQLYPDVAPALRRWMDGGVRLAVYSSGSEAAQRLLFAHTPDGDLTGWFAGFFDTRIGAKREAVSYAAIAAALRLPADELLFLSDIEAELHAAEASGWQTCHLVRANDATVASERHASAADFDAVGRLFELPAGALRDA